MTIFAGLYLPPPVFALFCCICEVDSKRDRYTLQPYTCFPRQQVSHLIVAGAILQVCSTVVKIAHRPLPVARLTNVKIHYK